MLGADGGRNGAWVVVVAEASGGRLGPARALVASEVRQVLEIPGLSLAALDVPIGLPDHAVRGGRLADAEARARLGRRSSTVFSAPCRASLDRAARLGFGRGAYPEVAEASREASPDRLALSKQAFFLLPRIHEVQVFLRARPELRTLVREVHPELSFFALAGPLPSKHRPEGIAARTEAIESAGIPLSPLMAVTSDRRVRTDDLLDACACLWSAARLLRGEGMTRPDPPPLDREGLPLAIHW